MAFFVPFENVLVEDLEIKVVLPEGFSDVKIDLPYPAEMAWTRRYTYLRLRLQRRPARADGSRQEPGGGARPEVRRELRL